MLTQLPPVSLTSQAALPPNNPLLTRQRFGSKGLPTVSSQYPSRQVQSAFEGDVRMLKACLARLAHQYAGNPQQLESIVQVMREQALRLKFAMTDRQIPMVLRKAYKLVPTLADQTVSEEEVKAFVNRMGKRFARTTDIQKQKECLQAASLAVMRYAQKQAEFHLVDKDLMEPVHQRFVSEYKTLAHSFKSSAGWRAFHEPGHNFNKVLSLPDYAKETGLAVRKKEDPQAWTNLALATWKQVFQIAGPHKSTRFLQEFDVNKSLKEGVLLICEEPKKWDKYKI